MDMKIAVNAHGVGGITGKDLGEKIHSLKKRPMVRILQSGTHSPGIIPSIGQQI